MVQFANQSFDKGKRGLYLPSARMQELTSYAESLEKARLEGREMSATEERMARSIGQLFSSFRFFHHAATWGQAEKPPGTITHRLLRETFKQSMIDQLIVNARMFQMRHMSHLIAVAGQEKGFHVVHKHHADPSFEITDEIKARIEVAEERLLRVNRSIHPTGIKDFFVKAIQAELIIDRKTAVIVRDRRNRPLSYHLVPGDFIKPRLEVLLPYMDLGGQGYWELQGARRREQEDRAVATIFDKFGVDVSNAAYIQQIDNIITGAWSADSMSVDISSPSDELNNWGYGQSCLERSVEATTLLLYAFNYNKSHFNANYPENLLVFEGDVDDVALEAFRQQVYAQVGPEGYHKLPMMSAGDVFGGGAIKPNLMKLRESIKDMEMPSLIRLAINLKLSAYRAHPSLLNMSIDRGGFSSGILSEGGTQEEALNLSNEEGFHSILENLADWLTRELLDPCPDSEDLKVDFETQCEPTQAEKIEIWSKKLQSGGYLIDEFRAALGDAPLDQASEGKLDGKWSSNQFFFEALGMQQQERQAMLAELYPEMEQGGYSGLEPPEEEAELGEEESPTDEEAGIEPPEGVAV